MVQRIRCFQKNKIDLDDVNVAITVTDAVATSTGQAIVDFIRNRNNTSAWLTSGSTDAANTTLEINMVDVHSVDKLLLIGHNWKAFTVQYWNGTIYTDFSTPISETVNTDETTFF